MGREFFYRAHVCPTMDLNQHVVGTNALNSNLISGNIFVCRYFLQQCI